jgi:multidrug resistance protein
MQKQDRNLLIISLVALVNMLGYGIVIPILYAYSKKFGLSDFQNGLLFASFSVCQFISTPIIGRLSDKYGRRPLLLISIMGTAVSFVLMAVAKNPWFLFAARVLDGLTAGNIPVAFAVISDTTEPAERPKAFGKIGAAFNFGFVFGPAISALTLGFGQGVPFWITAAVTLVAVVMTALYLPETNKHMGEVKKGKLFDLPLLWKTLWEPNVGTTFLISLVYMLAFSCAIIYGFQPFTMNILKLSQTQNAVLFTVFGAVGLISQTYVVGWVSKKWGVKKAFAGAMLFTGIAFAIMAVSWKLWMFVLASVILAIVNSIGQTLIPAIVSAEADAKSQGTMMGLNTSYQSIGMIFGPILGGMVATAFLVLPFVVGAGLMLVCFWLSFGILRTGIHKESAF